MLAQTSPSLLLWLSHWGLLHLLPYLTFLTVLKKFLPSGEKVLIIDDFLANGEAALGMARIVEKAGSTVAGIGIAIEKAFQKGHSRLIEAGYHLEALASIASLEDGKVTFTKK